MVRNIYHVTDWILVRLGAMVTRVDWSSARHTVTGSIYMFSVSSHPASFPRKTGRYAQGGKNFISHSLSLKNLKDQISKNLKTNFGFEI